MEDSTEYEYKYRLIVVLTTSIYITKHLIRRKIRSKTYEATIQEDPNTPELPAPSYLAGNSDIEANPENLSPVGPGTEEWHCDNVSYTKEISVPLSRNVRVTWVKNGAWEVIDESDSV